MSDANLSVNVSVEKAIHDALWTIGQEIFDKYGLIIDSVNYDWLDVSTSNKISLVLRKIELRTISGRNPD